MHQNPKSKNQIKFKARDLKSETRKEWWAMNSRRSAMKFQLIPETSYLILHILLMAECHKSTRSRYTRCSSAPFA